MITLDLAAGNYPYSLPTKMDIDKNIEALQRAIDGKPLGFDFVPHLDTISILNAIKAQLPD